MSEPEPPCKPQGVHTHTPQGTGSTLEQLLAVPHGELCYIEGRITDKIKEASTLARIESTFPGEDHNRLSRLIKTPKLHLGDTGLACALLGVDAAALHADRPLLGQLLETFVFQELRRQASWHEDRLASFHYRDKDGVEVDIVIERGARELVGVEVKAAATVSAADFRGLRSLREATGKRFVGGVVFYDGETSASFGDGLRAVPLQALWETV